MKLNEAIILIENVELVDRPGPLQLSNGQKPKVLFRVVDPKEWEQAQKTGFLSPSQFYGRIHASIKPERSYGMSDSVVLAIQYREQDDWTAKGNIDGDVYAVTDRRIPLSIVKDITGGM